MHLHGGPAPVRRFLPELIQLIWDREIDPGAVFDLTLPLEEAAEGYRAMDERRATKVLLTMHEPLDHTPYGPRGRSHPGTGRPCRVHG